MFHVKVYVQLKESILDPQGQAVLSTLQQLHYHNVKNVRIGKFIQLWMDGDNEEEIRKTVEELGKKILINDVIETFQYEIQKV